LFVTGVLGTESFENGVFSVYPNPVTDILNIKTRDAVNKISVYNVLGKLVYTATPNALSPTVNMSAMKTGVYFVEVTIGNTTKTVKVIR
ncbi:MAG: T9SS type A sorting domain-containing protein, partial [Flavobacteriia bacterium]|nr:T9SS type A sorting domain-containing protein [Flavobacteriia bacterium]